ncbi:Uncharacterised protein [Mycobacteroides abscessus subsp. abscessus]|nr:Uncharacterised protein [Mycobacteroides abscessus subsp. abscessus]
MHDGDLTGHLRQQPHRPAQHVIEVDHAPLLGVGQHLVGDADLFEPGLRLLIGVDVGVQLAGELAIGPLELAVAGTLAHPEDAVVITRHCVDLAPLVSVYFTCC